MKYSKREIRDAYVAMGFNILEWENFAALLESARFRYQRPVTDHIQVPTKQVMDCYFRFYEGLTGIPPIINAEDNVAAKNIASYLLKIVLDKDPNCSGYERAVEAWQLILSRFSQWTDYQQRGIKLAQIASNLNNIIAQIKSPNGKRTIEDRSISISRLVAEQDS